MRRLLTCTPVSAIAGQNRVADSHQLPSSQLTRHVLLAALWYMLASSQQDLREVRNAESVHRRFLHETEWGGAPSRLPKSLAMYLLYKTRNLDLKI